MTVKIDRKKKNQFFESKRGLNTLYSFKFSDYEDEIDEEIPLEECLDDNVLSNYVKNRHDKFYSTGLNKNTTKLETYSESLDLCSWYISRSGYKIYKNISRKVSKDSREFDVEEEKEYNIESMLEELANEEFDNGEQFYDEEE